MKTLVTLLKIAMLVTTLSFVMSCDNKKKSSNNNVPVYGNSIYTYGANGTCINSQNGQQVSVSYCQQQYNNGYGYGSQQCNGNSNLYIWSYADQTCSTQPTSVQNGYTQTYMCWKSCAYTNCSGQVAYPGGSQSQQQGYQCL